MECLEDWSYGNTPLMGSSLIKLFIFSVEFHNLILLLLFPLSWPNNGKNLKEYHLGHYVGFGLITILTAPPLLDLVIQEDNRSCAPPHLITL